MYFSRSRSTSRSSGELTAKAKNVGSTQCTRWRSTKLGRPVFSLRVSQMLDTWKLSCIIRVLACLRTRWSSVCFDIQFFSIIISLPKTVHVGTLVLIVLFFAWMICRREGLDGIFGSERIKVRSLTLQTSVQSHSRPSTPWHLKNIVHVTFDVLVCCVQTLVPHGSKSRYSVDYSYVGENLVGVWEFIHVYIPANFGWMVPVNSRAYSTTASIYLQCLGLFLA